jgi:hypothetical protein
MGPWTSNQTNSSSKHGLYVRAPIPKSPISEHEPCNNHSRSCPQMHLDPHKTSLRATRFSWYRTCTGATPPFLLQTQWAEPTTSKSCELWCAPNRSHPNLLTPPPTHMPESKKQVQSHPSDSLAPKFVLAPNNLEAQEPMAHLNLKQNKNKRRHASAIIWKC